MNSIAGIVLVEIMEEKKDEEAASSDGIMEVGKASAVCNEQPTYLALLANHPNYRWFLASYIVADIGEWLTYVASLSLVEKTTSTSSLAVSILVVVRLVPNTLFALVGGVLADTLDRRQIMMVIDVVGTGVALLYLLSDKSIYWLYVATLLQQSLTGMYEPTRSAILPSLVPDMYLTKAITVTACVWSSMTAIGASVGGFVAARYGVSVCFWLDAACYMVSAYLLTHVQGSFKVVNNNNKGQEPSSSSSSSPGQMLSDVKQYLTHSENGVFVMLKGCGALVFGASDVISVMFAKDDDDNGSMDTRKLGWLFASFGAGCLLAPLMLNDQRCWLRACVYAYAVLGLGYLLIGLAPHFWQKCLFNMVCAGGTAVLWIDSSTLLQSTTPMHLMGRVMAVDVGLATLSKAAAAVVAGAALDAGVAADQMALALGGLGFAFSLLWAIWMRFFRHVPATDQETIIELEPLN